MGEAKRRKVLGTSPPLISYERQLLAKAAIHFHKNFVVANKLIGGCYYVSQALRHHLGTVYGLDVATIPGFARPQRPGFRWSSHMWLEFEGQPTDITICMASPPNFPGKLLIDGQTRGTGQDTYYSKQLPNDGVIVDIEMSGSVGAEARKEHLFYTRLASEGLDKVGEYLRTAPPAYQEAAAVVWRSFKP